MAIAQENIERIQRMEGYLNDYAKTLEDTKKAVDRLKEHQESYIQLRNYYSSQAYFDFIRSRPLYLDLVMELLRSSLTSVLT